MGKVDFCSLFIHKGDLDWKCDPAEYLIDLRFYKLLCPEKLAAAPSK